MTAGRAFALSAFVMVVSMGTYLYSMFGIDNVVWKVAGAIVSLLVFAVAWAATLAFGPPFFCVHFWRDRHEVPGDAIKAHCDECCRELKRKIDEHE